MKTYRDKFIEELEALRIDGFKWNSTTKDLEEVRIAPTICKNHAPRVTVSAEDGSGYADYYGSKGYPVIHPKLEELAGKWAGFWEWDDPGSISFWPDGPLSFEEFCTKEYQS